jgi:hypothetical protein
VQPRLLLKALPGRESANHKLLRQAAQDTLAGCQEEILEYQAGSAI